MLLYDFGTLFRATIVHRPSKIIQSPYVADVKLLDAPHNTVETAHLAHCPALGCCGLSDVGAIVLVRILDGKKALYNHYVTINWKIGW